MPTFEGDGVRRGAAAAPVSRTSNRGELVDGQVEIEDVEVAKEVSVRLGMSAASNPGACHDHPVLNMSLITESVAASTRDVPDAPISRTDASVPASAADVISRLGGLVDELAACPSLRPSPDVDALFGRLVRTVIDTPAVHVRQVLGHDEVQSRLRLLRDLSARGEGELELSWANRVCASSDPPATLTRFPYLDNYRQLARMEIGVLASALNRPIRSLAFVGSGPLPLSAFFLAAGLNVAVDGFDRDPEVVSLSRRTAAETGFTGFNTQHADAADADLAGYDVVVLAAMVGTTSAEKASILGRMRDSMDPGTVLLARSTRDLRTLLYPPIDLDTLDGFDIQNVVHPANDIINSVVLATVLTGG